MPIVTEADRSDDMAENFRQLHQRLLDQDPLAPADLAEIFLVSLKAWLHARHRHLEDSLLWDAVTKALLNYAERPQIYDPARLSLPAYLRMAAEGDLRNELAKQSRYYRHNQPLEVVEVSSTDGNNIIEDQFLARQELVERLQTPSLSVMEVSSLTSLNELDRRILKLMQAGERRTAVYAHVIGLKDLPPDEQRRQVKRHKDRLKIWLKRQIIKKVVNTGE